MNKQTNNKKKKTDKQSMVRAYSFEDMKLERRRAPNNEL